MPKKEGLSASEVKDRLAQYGLNKLPEKPLPSALVVFINQLKSPLVYVLLAAGLVTLLLRDFSDSLIIFIAVFLNTILGFFQERRASKALYALKRLIQPQAEVVRDGKRIKILAEELVPGDVCILNTGDKVPADGTLLDVSRIFISEAVLTGESLPLGKEVGDKVYMGTVVTSGRGIFLVDSTGKNTELGKIALQVQEFQEDTPLRRQLVYFSRQLTILVFFLITFVFVIGLIVGKELLEIFTISVALAVSSIPEGLLVGLTVVLAIGMQKILKEKGLVKNLVSAETLGGVTTICIDKTGTLTQGQMQVTDVLGDEIMIAKQSLIANDLDDPLLTTLWSWANKKLTNKDLNGASVDDYLKKHGRIDSIPFSSVERYFASLNFASLGRKILFVNGAPEFLLEWCNLSKEEKLKVKAEIDRLTTEGKRILGMAKKEVDEGKKTISKNDVKKDLVWVGMVAFSDPIRSGVKEAFEKVKKAKVKLIVITGDYAQTARSVLKNIGLEVKESQIVLGDDLEKLSLDSLREKLKKNESLLFARTTPSQKLKIVKALKKNNEVVAMMGDGVNDAPALKHADIGIVVGDATDVAKESADLILLDSSFATIVSAIEEGRGIFDNIRKIVLYLMSNCFSEITAVVGALIFNLPLPLSAGQILWINLVSDSFPHLALTVDPKDENLMNLPPRNPNEKIIAPWMKKLMLTISLISGFFALLIFVVVLTFTKNENLARSIAFAMLGTISLFYVFSIRYLRGSSRFLRLFDNKWLNIAVFSGFVLQIFPFLFNKTREFLNLEILELRYWLMVILLGVFVFLIFEILKKRLIRAYNNL